VIPLADNKKPQPELGLVGGCNEANMLAEDGETTRDVSKVSLFLWLKYAEPVQTPGRIKGRSGAARRFRRIREAIGRSIGHREAGHIGACREVARIAACREVSRIAVWEAVVRIAGCLGLIRSRDH
jgi:hypothetical protein